LKQTVEFFVPESVTNELIYEVLKHIQQRIGNLADDMGHVKARITSVDTRLGLVHKDMAIRSGAGTAIRK
jgi:hypothetical protein